MLYKRKAVIAVTAVTGSKIDKSDVVLASTGKWCHFPMVLFQQASPLGALTRGVPQGKSLKPLKNNKNKGEKTMNKKERIKFWLDDNELSLLDKKAKKAGLSRSAFIRKMIDRANFIPAADIDYKKYENVFRGLNNDLKLQVKKISMTGEINYAEISEIMSEIKKECDLFLNDLRSNTLCLESAGDKK